MDLRYRLADDTIDDADLGELVRWLEGKPWLTMGPLTVEFEQRWAAWLGVEHALFVNSGSSANLLMYWAAHCSGRLRNRKVVVPAVSWATTVTPAIQLGFEPIMCDADWTTFGLDVVALARLLEAHDPALVILVHVLGVPVDLEPLLRLKARHDFMLLEDCCAATGSRYEGRPVGTFGEMASFSFYFGHHLSTIEGGMVCVGDEALHDILLHVRSHGWSKDLARDKEALLAREHDVLDFNRRFTFYHPGFNVRPTDLNARLGLSQLAKADRVVARRMENDAAYRARFAGAPGFHAQANPRAAICSISFAALAASLEHRDRVGRALDEHGVETRPLGGGNMSRQPFWTERYGAQAFHVADQIHERSFMLPNHPGLSVADVHRICDITLAVEAER